MTKREITSKSNADLIMCLCEMMASYKILKGNMKDALSVCAELENRGVVNPEDELYSRWLKRYHL